jgi:hypothetical protein
LQRHVAVLAGPCRQLDEKALVRAVVYDLHPRILPEGPFFVRRIEV